MKNRLLNLTPYLAILAIDFYLLPFLVKNTSAAMLMMLCVMPLIAFVSAVMYGVRSGFSLLLPAAASILFLPTIFIHYNSSAWGYVLFYAFIILLGNGIGRIFYMKR